MLLTELFESVATTPSALNQLMQNANSLYTLYADRLIPLVKNMYAEGMHEDMLRTTKKVVGQAKGKWFSDNYLSTSTRRDTPTSGLKNALQALSKDPNFSEARSTLQELGSFTLMMSSEKLFKETGQSSGQYVSQLEAQLPKVMKVIARRASGEFRDRLNKTSVRLENIIDSFYSMWDKLQREYDRDWGTPDPEKAAKEREKQDRERNRQAQGGQASQAEAIVNQVLSTLDKRVAAEIRPILARSDNKLMTLQQELSKRGIKI